MSKRTSLQLTIVICLSQWNKSIFRFGLEEPCISRSNPFNQSLRMMRFWKILRLFRASVTHPRLWFSSSVFGSASYLQIWAQKPLPFRTYNACRIRLIVSISSTATAVFRAFAHFYSGFKSHPWIGLKKSSLSDDSFLGIPWYPIQWSYQGESGLGTLRLRLEGLKKLNLCTHERVSLTWSQKSAQRLWKIWGWQNHTTYTVSITKCNPAVFCPAGSLRRSFWDHLKNIKCHATCPAEAVTLWRCAVAIKEIRVHSQHCSEQTGVMHVRNSGALSAFDACETRHSAVPA